jgi:hypothetical protein
MYKKALNKLLRAFLLFNHFRAWWCIRKYAEELKEG